MCCRSRRGIFCSETVDSRQRVGLAPHSETLCSRYARAPRREGVSAWGWGPTRSKIGRDYTRGMRRLTAAALVAGLVAATAAAQDFGFRGFGFRGRFQIYPNTAYDGRFTFVRIRYT